MAIDPQMKLVNRILTTAQQLDPASLDYLIARLAEMRDKPKDAAP